MKPLRNDFVIDNITGGIYSLRQSIAIATTNKRFVLFLDDNIHMTNDLTASLIRISKDYPINKANELEIIDAKKYQDYLTNNN